MNRFLKEILHTVIVILIAAIIEMYIINGNYWLKWLEMGDAKQNLHYTLEDAELLNWDTSGEKPVTMFDPIILINDIDTTIDTICIKVNAQGDIPYIDIFYINDEHKIPDYDNLIKVQPPFEYDNIVIDVNQYINLLRIDLGDFEGLVVQDFELIINENVFSFSLVRMIAIIMIYYATVFLFKLQDTPKYMVSESQQETNNVKFNLLYIVSPVILVAIIVIGLLILI